MAILDTFVLAALHSYCVEITVAWAFPNPSPSIAGLRNIKYVNDPLQLTTHLIHNSPLNRSLKLWRATVKQQLNRGGPQ